MTLLGNSFRYDLKRKRVVFYTELTCSLTFPTIFMGLTYPLGFNKGI